MSTRKLETADRETARRIRRLCQRPREAESQSWARDAAFVDAFLYYSLNEITADPSRGPELVDIALRIAPTVCQAVQAWGLNAQVQRSQGRLDEALDTITTALRTLGAPCVACRADLLRRESTVLRDLRRFPDALRAVEEAISHYRDLLGGPGHDLDGNGLASSYLARASIHCEAGEPDLAVSDAGQALEAISPAVSPELHRVATFNTAAFLSMTGRRADLLLADQRLRVARRLFQGHRKCSQEQAKLAWLTAMVRRELKIAKPHRIREDLTRARRHLLQLGFLSEGAAVTADMTRIAFPDRRRIREALEGLSLDLREFDRELPAEIRAAVDRVQVAFETRAWDARTRLQDAVRDLRRICGPRMLACLVSWRPLRI